MKTPSTDRIDDSLAEEAAGWLARIQSDDASEADHKRFQEWIDASSAHREAYEEMKELWGEMRNIKIALPSDAKRAVSGKKAAAAASLLCLCGLAGLFASQSGMIERYRADYYTDIGQTSTFTLDDGTRVSLNTDAAIQVRYTGSERRVMLLRGEAFFDVAKNPQRPFIVVSDEMTAKALGTHYGVKAADGSGHGQVQVEEGSVEVETPEGATRLAAGDVVTLDSTGKAIRSRRDVSANTAWRDGKLIFSDQSLGEVLDTLEHYRRGRIVILDKQAASLSVSGIFDLGNTDQALHILESSLPVTVTRLSGMVVLVRSR